VVKTPAFFAVHHLKLKFFTFMNFKPASLRSSNARRFGGDRGFALVVTLSLMILLTVIAVGLLSLSSISLRASSRAGAQQQAQANARLAMMMALGELQKELGPDQRISAPGSQLLEEANATGPKHWTGAYESWKGTSWPFASGSSEEILQDVDREKTFRRWLISGAETIVTNKDTPKTGLTTGDKVKLVSATKAQGSTPAQDAVEAGLVKIPQGGTAWWIGDQNTKAKLGGVVEDAADAKVAAARLQSAPRAAHEVFPGLEGVPASDERLGKLPSTDSLELLSEDIQPFHDATTTSLGLLTNVRAGGLRKDLNFLLEKPSPSITTALYSADAPNITYSTGNVPYQGINFLELWVDHQIWGEVEYNGLPPHAGGFKIPANAPFIRTGAKGDLFLSYKHLPRLQVKLIYSLIGQSKQVAGKTVYDVYLVVEPIYTIWNPFDVCIYADPGYFATLRTWGISYKLTIRAEKGAASPTTGIPKTFGQLGAANLFLRGKLGNTSESAENLVLRPGEVQILAQGFGEPLKVKPAAGELNVNCKLGYEFASGYKYTKEKANSFDIPASDPDPAGNPSFITYRLEPETGRDPNALLNSSYFISNTVDQIGSFNTGLVYSQTANESSLNATQRPDIFPTFDFDDQYKIKVEELDGKKWPICVHTYGLRTEFDPYPTAGKRFTGRSMLRANATALGYDLFDLKGDNGDILRTSPLQHGMVRVNNDKDPAVVPQMDPAGTGLGFFGAGYGIDQGVSHVVTRSIPREPIHSLGALQHGAAEGRVISGSALRAGERQFNLQPSVSHAIANSFAPSFLAPSAVRGTLASRPAADHSYLANLALWDTYFYSSIKPTEKKTSAYRNATKAYSQQKDLLSAFLKESKPLPNERMRRWTSDPEAAIDNIFNGSNPRPEAADRIASYLMMDGMFNVNSTSVAAWKAFLSGLKKAKVPSNSTTDLKSQPDLLVAEGTAVAGLLEAAGEEIDDTTLGDPSDAEQWRGFRSLSDDQIDELAKAIVKQVRKRGPFLSIADFVNRRPGSDKDLAVSGALQSALDDNDVSINEAYRQGERSLSLAEAQAKGFPFPEAEAGPKAIGSPGYVKQGDLLTSLGPMIAVRGDTFVIRGYGEAREGNNVAARSWCEAVVQRVPDYVDPSDKAYAALPKSKVNLTFGRRFNIVSFRYLDSREIL
jgi:Tfp pilus assembly protein PilX